MPVRTGAPLAELAAELAAEELALLDEDEAALLAADELALLEEAALDAAALELALLEEAALDDEVEVPQAEAASVAPFLPTPATLVSLSFTHCAEIGSYE